MLTLAVLRLAHRIVVHSARNRDALAAQGFDAARISVVPMGLHTVGDARASREDARRQLDVPADARVVLLFGNLRPYKGVDVLLDAASRMRAAVPRLLVVVAGELWADCPDPRVRIAALGLGDVVRLRPGFVPDDEAGLLFAAADVVVLPYTHFDGQSASATLALSAGRALVVSDTGGLPELVRDARAVVPPGDARWLAAALTAVLNDDGLRARLEGDAEAVAATLGWMGVAEATAAVYRDALGGRPAAGVHQPGRREAEAVLGEPRGAVMPEGGKARIGEREDAA
jgi:glycosyltransferase involved in cell wall biosynthesis